MVSNILCNISGVSATSNVITVPDDYPTIQSAIDSAQSGDTVFVRSGTYFENIIVNKSISLIGNNRETTIIEGVEGSYLINGVVEVLANNVVIKGLTITSSVVGTRGIYLNSVSGGLLEDLIVENIKLGPGIRLFKSRSNEVKNCNAISCYEGVVIGIASTPTASEHNKICNNKIIGCNTGIKLHYSRDNSVSNNELDDGGSGVRLFVSHDNVITDNLIQNNSAAFTIDEYSSGNKIYNNTCLNNSESVYMLMESEINTWDNGSIGNYWSDYTGQDGNGDNIGDTPCIFDGNNTDRFPLMSPYFIPEFPSWTLLLLFFVVVPFMIIFKKNRLPHNN